MVTHLDDSEGVESRDATDLSLMLESGRGLFTSKVWIIEIHEAWNRGIMLY
jgi:hypothetical protein